MAHRRKYLQQDKAREKQRTEHEEVAGRERVGKHLGYTQAHARQFL